MRFLTGWTKENVIINMSVKGEDFGNAISFTGTNAGVVIKIYDVYGESPLTRIWLHRSNLSK